MIFYDCITAPSPRRARIVLAEKNVSHEVVNIDLRKNEQMSEAFRAINPDCTVPVLQLDDGTLLTENAGIAAYLEAAYPEPPLFGRNPVEKGLVMQWTAKIELQGFLPIANALRNGSPAMQDRAVTGSVNWPQIPELAARGKARTELFFDMLNEHLKDRDYIAIDEFSNADITAVVAVDFAKVIQVRMQEQHEHLKRWRERLNQRPSCVFKK
ncbi:MAG: glutathione S-transferase family protein [Gammaproteobacteria bacterium]|nr:glutathione S-transferase family protein [Gammaproteobacteria bacterium]